jgi:hydroxymethylbilane synthase
MLRLRPDLDVVKLRGNVPTRLRKIREDDFDAGILAAAGLERLDLMGNHCMLLPPELFLPAVNQGILAAQFLSSRVDVGAKLGEIRDASTEAVFKAERKVIELLEADCSSAVGVLARVKGEALMLQARVFTPDGREMIEATYQGHCLDDEAIGDRVGTTLLDRGAQALAS